MTKTKNNKKGRLWLCWKHNTEDNRKNPAGLSRKRRGNWQNVSIYSTTQEIPEKLENTSLIPHQITFFFKDWRFCLSFLETLIKIILCFLDMFWNPNFDVALFKNGWCNNQQFKCNTLFWTLCFLNTTSFYPWDT